MHYSCCGAHFFSHVQVGSDFQSINRFPFMQKIVVFMYMDTIGYGGRVPCFANTFLDKLMPRSIRLRILHVLEMG